jgi:predicted O-methyltransferase YrrM
MSAIRATLKHDIRAQIRQVVPEAQAAVALDRLVAPQLPLPPFGGWAVPPSLANALVAILVTERPATVVELGSGASTSLMAEAIRAFNLETRVISLDHDESWAERTRADLRQRKDSRIEVRAAPLTDIEIDGTTFRWYDTEALRDVDDIDLLVVDGPPQSTGPLARYPAGPVLLPIVRPGGVVLVDDISRSDETEMLCRWGERFSLSRRLETPISDRFAAYRVLDRAEPCDRP